MALELSTGLRSGMLNSTGIKEAFANGTIFVYNGPQPINADAAVQGTLLGQVTLNGGAFTFGTSTNGINFDAPVLNVVSKARTIPMQPSFPSCCQFPHALESGGAEASV